jgi:predicted Zn-dependent protease
VKVGEALFAVRDRLAGGGWEEVEVFHKRGRSRTLRYGPGGEVASFRQEEGWAVRAGDRHRSFFHAATGAPRPDVPWPEAGGGGLRLPSPRAIPRWSPPSSLDAPLVGESEAHGLFAAVGRELERELPGARLIAGELEDGSSESQLLSSREVAAAVRHRAAFLRLEAVGSGSGDGARRRSVALVQTVREARRFAPTSLARRLADRLLIAEQGSAPRRDRGEFLLAPPVAVGLLAALSELWIGPQAEDRAAALVDRRGRLASPAFTLIDDGRLAGGIFAAPVDGEGQPTREVVLVEEGGFRQPLLAWWQAPSDPQRASGCVLRPGWRDLPRQSPTHLYLRPEDSTSVASLVADLARGYYLLALDGEPRIDGDRFTAPVAGFAIDRGAATGSLTGAWLTGSIPALLTGVVAVARDLTFLPSASGLVGSPTVLVKGLELRQPSW